MILLWPLSVGDGVRAEAAGAGVVSNRRSAIHEVSLGRLDAREDTDAQRALHLLRTADIR
jgi:hypothetical protein